MPYSAAASGEAKISLHKSQALPGEGHTVLGMGTTSYPMKLAQNSKQRSVLSDPFVMSSQESSAVPVGQAEAERIFPSCQGHTFPTFHERSLICFCCWWLEIIAAVLSWAFFSRISSGPLNRNSGHISLSSQSLPWVKSYLPSPLSQKDSSGKRDLALKRALL